MRIALSLALVAVLAAACSKKEEAAKAPEAAAPAAPAAPALAAADLEGPKPGKCLGFATKILPKPKFVVPFAVDDFRFRNGVANQDEPVANAVEFLL